MNVRRLACLSAMRSSARSFPFRGFSKAKPVTVISRKAIQAVSFKYRPRKSIGEATAPVKVQNPRKGKGKRKVDIVTLKAHQKEALKVLDTRMMLNEEEIESSLDIIGSNLLKTTHNPGIVMSDLLNRCFADVKAERKNEIRKPRERIATMASSEDEQKAVGMGVNAAIDRLERVFGYICEHGDPRISHYGMVMSAYLENDRPEKALETYHLMVQDRITPDVTSCNLLIRSLLGSGREDGALHVFRAMKRSRRHPAPDSHTFVSLVSHFTAAGSCQDFKKAQQMITEMEDAGVASPHAYGVLVKALVQAGENTVARKVVEDMKAVGVEPNIIIYNSLLGGFARVGDAKSVASLLQDMVANGIAPNDVTSMEIFNGYKSCGPEAALAAVDTLDTMVESFDNFSAHHSTLLWLAESAGIMLTFFIRGKRPKAELRNNIFGVGSPASGSVSPMNNGEIQEENAIHLDVTEDSNIPIDLTEVKQKKRASYIVEKTSSSTEGIVEVARLEFQGSIINTVEDALEVFEAALDHGLNKKACTRIKSSNLSLLKIETPEAALLCLEHALQSFISRKGRKPTLAPGGLYVRTSGNNIPYHLKLALQKFRPKITAIEGSPAPIKKPKKSVVPEQNTLIINRSSLLKWVKDPKRKGLLYSLQSKHNEENEKESSKE